MGMNTDHIAYFQSAEGIELSRAAVARYGPDTCWYHGGEAGRKVGDELLPPMVSGMVKPTMTRSPWRFFLVYITPNRSFAEVYAKSVWSGNGAIYTVRPKGVIVADPDELFPGVSPEEIELFACAGSAEVLEVEPVTGTRWK